MARGGALCGRGAQGLCMDDMRRANTGQGRGCLGHKSIVDFQREPAFHLFYCCTDCQLYIFRRFRRCPAAMDTARATRKKNKCIYVNARALSYILLLYNVHNIKIYEVLLIYS